MIKPICRKIERYFVPYIEGTLEVQKKEMFITHLGRCITCRQKLKSAAEMDALLHGVFTRPKEFPSWLWELVDKYSPSPSTSKIHIVNLVNRIRDSLKEDLTILPQEALGLATRGEGKREDLEGEIAVADDKIVGFILDKSGKRVVGASVELCRKKKKIATATTNHQGRFLFENLVPGDYTVVFAEVREQVRVISGKEG
jgi:hypothetical protein